VRSHVRHLTSSDVLAALELTKRDPVAHCFVQSRIQVAGADPWRMGGEILGYFSADGLESMVFLGANLIPVATTPATRAAFADRLRSAGRRCSSFVGPAEEVLDLWRLLEPAWGPAREVRADQPLLAISTDAVIEPDVAVRRVDISEIEILLPACIAMFTEEVGVSPVSSGSGHAYRARIAELIRSGRAFARIDDGTVVFKAEVGAATKIACQVQGVWVDPRLRGRGYAAPGVAAVVNLARASVAPVISLYVNDYNTAARKAYARVGFENVGTFATVLF
jgi:predicted GNAT family acetyltransferase